MVLTALAAKLERPGLPLYAKVLAGTDTAALAAAVQAFPNDPLAATAREKIAKEAERINQEANRVRASLDAITPAQAPEPPPQRKPIWPFLVAAGVLAAVGLVGVLIAIGALRLPFSAPIAAIESNGQAAAPIAAPAPVPEDVAAWTGLNQANRDDLRAFLNRYPASIHAEAAKSALAGIALSELEAAQTLNAPAALASWAQAWPDQPQAAVAAAQAQKRRAELSSPAYKSWSGEVPDCVASPLKIAFVNGQISSESAYRAALEGLVRNARRCALDYVLLEGHARFGAGTVERLAASRAMVTQVRDLLIEQGVPRGLIRERGYGDTRYLPASAAPTVDPGDRVEVSVVFVEEGK
jgi:outer membrane protein OmpA-like peptidoglycan-associated protein